MILLGILVLFTIFFILIVALTQSVINYIQAYILNH